MTTIIWKIWGCYSEELKIVIYQNTDKARRGTTGQEETRQGSAQERSPIVLKLINAVYTILSRQITTTSHEQHGVSNSLQLWIFVQKAVRSTSNLHVICSLWGEPTSPCWISCKKVSNTTPSWSWCDTCINYSKNGCNKLTEMKGIVHWMLPAINGHAVHVWKHEHLGVTILSLSMKAWKLNVDFKCWHVVIKVH